MGQKLKLVGGDANFHRISDELDAHVQELIEQYKLSPKMETKLLLGLYRNAERRSAADRERYISTRFDEEVARYIEAGVSSALSFADDEYRALFAPLRERVLSFFAPPTLHPIMDGEWAFQIVHPPEMISLRSLAGILAGLRPHANRIMSPDLQRALRDGGEVTTLTEFGSSPPKTPYALIGVNGGRMLEGYTTAQANVEIRHYEQKYFSLHQQLQMYIQQPHWLPGRSEAIVLGDRLPAGFVKFISVDGVPHMDIVSAEEAMRTGSGVGKAYYNKLITV